MRQPREQRRPGRCFPLVRRSECVRAITPIVAANREHCSMNASGIRRPERNSSIERLDQPRGPRARGRNDRTSLREGVQRHATDAIGEIDGIVRLQADAAVKVRRVLPGRRRLPDERNGP